MSHEIRTPLNAIIGFSSLLTTTEDKHEREEFISIIENNNQLLLQLISDILDLSKIEANTLDFNYQHVDLNGLARDVERTVRRRLQPNVVLNFIPELPSAMYKPNVTDFHKYLSTYLSMPASLPRQAVSHLVMKSVEKNSIFM